MANIDSLKEKKALREFLNNEIVKQEAKNRNRIRFEKLLTEGISTDKIPAKLK